jgi:hypothetical protein
VCSAFESFTTSKESFLSLSSDSAASDALELWTDIEGDGGAVGTTRGGDCAMITVSTEEVLGDALISGELGELTLSEEMDNSWPPAVLGETRERVALFVAGEKPSRSKARLTEGVRNGNGAR